MSVDPDELDIVSPEVSSLVSFVGWAMLVSALGGLAFAGICVGVTKSLWVGLAGGGCLGALPVVLLTRWMWKRAHRPLRLRRAERWVVGHALDRPLPVGSGVICVTESERRDSIDGSFDTYVYAVAHVPFEPERPATFLFEGCREPLRVYEAAKALCRFGGWGLEWAGSDEDVERIRPPEILDEPLVHLVRRSGPPALQRPSTLRWEIAHEGHNGVRLARKDWLGRRVELVASREGISEDRQRVTPAEVIEDIYHVHHRALGSRALVLVGNGLYRSVGAFDSYEEAEFVRCVLLHALTGELPRELFEPPTEGARVEREAARV